MDVNFGNQQPMPSLNIVKDASVPGGTANVVGEVITYTITVQNTGNQMLTGVTVSDPMISDLMLVADAASADGELDVGESWTWTAPPCGDPGRHRRGRLILNVATADSDQTGPDTDDASVMVEQTAALNIVKDASVAGGTAKRRWRSHRLHHRCEQHWQPDFDRCHCRRPLHQQPRAGGRCGLGRWRAGCGTPLSLAARRRCRRSHCLCNQRAEHRQPDIDRVTVADPFISNLVLVGDAASADGELDVGETWSYTASHVVTQAEIDAGTPIVNVATADSNQTGPDTDDASVAVEQSAALNIVKDASVAGGTADSAGENTGNQTLTGVTVADPFISNLTLVADAASADGELDVPRSTPVSTSSTSRRLIPTRQALTPTTLLWLLNKPWFEHRQGRLCGGWHCNAAGEVIAYAISVQNTTGNQTLTGVTVADPFISNLLLVADAASADGELDVGETWVYTASHVVTQAEIDAGTPIVNVATADSNQTGPDTDDASVVVEQAPAISVDKAIATITGGNGNTSADAAGDVLNYTITVSNPGNVTLTDVTSPMAEHSGLDLGTRTKPDLPDQLCADTARPGQQRWRRRLRGEHRHGRQHPNQRCERCGAHPGAATPLAGPEQVFGPSLVYTATVINQGTVTLTNVSVTDVSTGLNVTVLTLAPGESAVYGSTYTLTQADVDSNGDGDGYHDNIALADSDQTAQLSDAESTPLLRPSAWAWKRTITGGNNNGFADQAGESLNYSINVYNAGTVTLTNVTVVDDLTGLSQTIASLAPGANQLYQTSYTLTQADLDSNGGGNGYIENATVVDSDQTLPGVDNETVQLIRSPVLYLDKTFVNVTGGNGNNLIDAVGDVLNYRIVVANPSNVTLTEVSVSEPLTGLTINGLTLAPGQTQTYLTSYTLTQADIDNNGGGDGYIDNVAVADSAQTTSVSDIESVPVLRTIGMDFDKGIVGINGGNGNDLADAAGDVLNYVFTVNNPGSVTLTNLTVVDNLTGLSETLASLAPGATVTYNSSYVLTQADLDSNAGGDGGADQHRHGRHQRNTGVHGLGRRHVRVGGQRRDLDDANGPTGPLLSSASGIDPQFRFTVTNTGNITLGDVTLTDAVYDLNGAEAGGAYSFGSLAVGASAEFIFTGAAWAVGQQSGDAAVSVAAMPLVLDIDNAYYLAALLPSWCCAQSLQETVLTALAHYPSIASANPKQKPPDLTSPAPRVLTGLNCPGTYNDYRNDALGNRWTQTPTLSLNLWSGGRIQSDVERSEALAKASQKQEQITRDDVALLSSEAYLQWAHARQMVRHDNARLVLLKNETERAVAAERLARMLMAPAPAEPSGLDFSPPVPYTSLDQAQAQLGDQHPVIARLLAQREAAAASIRYAQAQHAPTVNLTHAKSTTPGITDGPGIRPSGNAADPGRRTGQRLGSWLSSSSRATMGMQQALTAQDLARGYVQQFRVGRRSLLDLLKSKATCTPTKQCGHRPARITSVTGPHPRQSGPTGQRLRTKHHRTGDANTHPTPPPRVNPWTNLLIPLRIPQCQHGIRNKPIAGFIERPRTRPFAGLPGHDRQTDRREVHLSALRAGFAVDEEGRIPMNAYPDLGRLHGMIAVWSRTELRQIPSYVLPVIVPLVDGRAVVLVSPCPGSGIRVWRYKGFYIESMMAAVVANVLTLAAVFFAMNVYDRVVPTQAYTSLWTLAIGTTVAILLEFGVRWLKARLVDLAGRKADLSLNAMLLREIMAIRLEHRPQSIGIFASSMRDFESLRDFMSSASMVMVVDMPFILLFLVLIGIIGGPIAWIPAAAVPILVIVGLWAQRPLMRAMRENMKESATSKACWSNRC
ncbi:LOW QUALITY PROTEIN: putative leukotoxin translocation ATP-binding protein LktB-like [Daphnia sinensis]|uniref:Leukotoxin translocation ATP-binding protein LktB-like n=1 Tax=Daphnia sinensis TaxID=1820382 RepID=A0AAD5PK26_9CRUS|nr:LOW QUALITY PROTEIN: putative leukotoxin translocation ATP-binding protein LktB-like [Daphnia sinensis]